MDQGWMFMQKLINLQQSVFTLKHSHTICRQLLPHKRADKDTGTLSEHLCNILNLILMKLFSLSKSFEIQKTPQYII